MLYREIIAVCAQIHTRHTNTAVWAERRIVEYSLAVQIIPTGHYMCAKDDISVCIYIT